MLFSSRFLRPLSLCAAVAIARAQEPAASAEVRANVGPLNQPVPLAKTAVAPLSPAAIDAALSAAKRAQELGLPAIAVTIYRQLVDAGVAEREAITMALITALLDVGDAAEAQKVLATVPEPHGAAWRLRFGIASLQLHKRAEAQASWDAIKEQEVSPEDRAWYWFFTGALYDTAPVVDTTKANEFYLKAEAAATTELSRARFKLAEERVRLRLLATPTAEGVEQIRKNYEQQQGKQPSYGIAETYAVGLSMLNRGAEAVEFLQRRVLLMLPPQERVWRDRFNLLIGLMGDASRTGPVRVALTQLLETGSDPERQRQALQLLATASEKEPGRSQFRAQLNKLISATPAHPIKESLLFYRAQLALAVKDYSQAEDDANTLLKQFPGSPLRMHAYGVLTGSAWEQGRFRLAASNARQARAELAGAVDPALLDTRARLGVLEAEAWFRAGDAADYRNAADAYAAVLREHPVGVPPGDLMFQRVLAEIKSGSPNAAKVLDEIEADPAFDAGNRWQAEWNLARELQMRMKEGVRDGLAEAYARVNRLLAAPATDTTSVGTELRARMAWLQARLSYETGEYEHTLALADALAKPSGEMEATLKKEISSTAVLLKAEAQFALKKDAEALKTLQQLREDPQFAKTDAAMSSYLIEADYLAAPGHDQIVKAQKLLTELADKFSDKPYAAYALYQAAVLAERLGQEDNYREADRLLVDLVKKYPASELVFAAQLKEGDLLEKLNQLPQAQRVYQELEIKFPRHREVVRAQLALAMCLNAQAAGNPSYLATAQAKFEQLLGRVDAPAGVRVQAGYNLGELLARRDNADKAIEVWWRDVVQKFLLEDKAVAAGLLDEKSYDEKGDPIYRGRYWMARTLVSLGDLLEQRGKFEDAKRAWSLVLESKLGYDSLVTARLTRAGALETKP